MTRPRRKGEHGTIGPVCMTCHYYLRSQRDNERSNAYSKTHREARNATQRAYRAKRRHARLTREANKACCDSD